MSAPSLNIEIRDDPPINEEGVIQENQPQEQQTDETIGNNSLQDNGRSSWFRSIMEGGKKVRNNQPKEPKKPEIPKVVDKLKKNGNEECYNPLVVSIGPYHHNPDPQNKLSEVETFKVPMTCQFIEESGKDIAVLYREVETLTAIAREFYNESSIEGFNDEQFSRMMFLDGCFILQFIICVTSNYNNLEMSDQQIADVKRDLLLLENQLPFPVLQSLMSFRYEKEHGMKLMCDFLVFHILQPEDQPLWRQRFLWPGIWLLLALILFILCPISLAIELYKDNPSASDERLLALVERRPTSGVIAGIFFILSVIAGIFFLLNLLYSLSRLLILRKRGQAYGNPDQQPAHLLGLLYSIFVCSGEGKGKPSLGRCRHYMSCLGTRLKKFILVITKSKSAVAQGSRGHYLYRSAKDLKKVGIHFTCSPASTLMDVKFKSSCFYGILKLPSITIDVSTKSILFNLVAYETSAALVPLWVSSYLCFMDSLIDDADDVVELRSKGILNNFLGGDQQVADLFNHMGSSLKPDTSAYNDVKRDVNRQCGSVMNKWVAQWQQTYFSSPWAFIAFAAAAVGLALTAAQTYYASQQTDYALLQIYYAAHPPKT